MVIFCTMGQVATVARKIFERPYVLVGLMLWMVLFIFLYFLITGTIQEDIAYIGYDLSQTVQSVSQSMSNPAFVEANAQQSVVQIIWNTERFQTSFWWLLRQFALLAVSVFVLFTFFHSFFVSILLKQSFRESFLIHSVFFGWFLLAWICVSLANVITSFQLGISLDILFIIVLILFLYLLLASFSLDEKMSLNRRFWNSFQQMVKIRFLFFVPCALFLLPWTAYYLSVVLNIPFLIHPALGFIIQIPLLFFGYCFTVMFVGGNYHEKRKKK